MTDRTEAMVLGIDPGLTVGWSIGVGEDRTDGGEESIQEFLEWLSIALSAGVVDRVVYERFDIRGRNQESIETLKLIGAIEYLVRKADLPMATVEASARHRCLDEVVAQRKWSSPHARDAEAVRLWDSRYGHW